MEEIISLYLLPKLISPESIIKDLEINGVKLVSNLNNYHIYSRLSNYLRLLPEDISQFLIHENIYKNLIKLFNYFLQTDDFKYNLDSKINIFSDLISKYFHKSIIQRDLLNMISLEVEDEPYFIRIRFNKFSDKIEISCLINKVLISISNKTYNFHSELFRITLRRNNENINKSLVEIKFGIHNLKKIYLPEMKLRSIPYIESLKYRYSI